MKRFFKTVLALAIFYWTAVVYIYHAGVARPPDLMGKDKPAQARWFDRKTFGINHVVLIGQPYGRGVRYGELTQNLLLAQEESLVEQLDRWFPGPWIIRAMTLAAMVWFQGLDDYVEPEHLAEMYGVSVFAPRKFNYLADGFTRQVAYHGVHEVGQMMVDKGVADMGCTVVAIPRGENWIIGRNFDLEGGRIFDSEKVVKWVFPEQGYAFVSVIWAGMVGAVTGVNEHGLYISINAAGSDDFSRVATPSTLLITKVLQNARTTQEAEEILKKAKMFITDIFVVVDRQGVFSRVEKSPKRTEILRHSQKNVIANHLLSPGFKYDKTNLFRQRELTTLARQKRGEVLAGLIPANLSDAEAVNRVLEIMRDKGVDEYGRALHLSNRRGIDALIATHAVIYDSARGYFYVSQGPALAGQFYGYDLRRSFAKREPIFTGVLPRDPMLSDYDFHRLKEVNQMIGVAKRLVRVQKCTEALTLLTSMEARWQQQSPYQHALGNAQFCLNRKAEARQAWERALSLVPAYAKDEEEIRQRLTE